MPVGVFVGLSTLDVIHQVDAAPGANEKVTARHQAIAAGGPATNAAVTFAALGGDAVLVTAIGAGAAAHIVRSDLRACGVEVIDVAPDQADRVPVSAVLVMARTGERSVVSMDAGTSSVENIPDLSGVIEAADVVLLDGHHAAVADQASRWAELASVPLVLDAGRWRPVMKRVIPRASAVICSADFRHIGAEDSASSAAMLVAADVPTVVVTRGADPLLWWHGGRSGSVTPEAVRSVDTSGAGDVFHGAYCFYASQGKVTDLSEQLRAASRIASLKCSYFGTRSWLDHLVPS